MPTPIGHSIAGIAIKSYAHDKVLPSVWRSWIISLIAVNLPDLDFLFGYMVGNPNKYHHQFTHSFTFALMAGFCLAMLLGRQDRKQLMRSGIYVFILICSHLGLDFVTKDTHAPYGEMLLWPFSKCYFISPVVIFSDVHRASTSSEFLQSLFNEHNLRTILLEVVTLLPFWLFGRWIGMRKNRKRDQ